MPDFGKGGLTGLQQVAALPRWPAGASEAVQHALVREEADIRDQLTAYGYAYDNQDLDAVMGFFTDDCVIVNPRGQYAGATAIRDNYKVLFGYWSSTRHLWTNVTVRFPDRADEAYVAAYHYATLISDDRKLAGVGTDIRRLVKLGGEWKIAERWITDDVDHVITVHEGAVEEPEKVAELENRASG